MRTFFAIDLPPLPSWDPGRPGPAEEPSHLTVRFLGDLPPSRLPVLEAAGARAVRGIAPFPITLAPIGAFPSEREPRIVWVGVDDGRDALGRLALRLSEELGRERFPAEPRPFVPHVTWRRIRGRSDRSLAEAWLAQRRLPAPIEARVDSLLLKESELRPERAVHTTLATFPLGAEASSSEIAPRRSVPRENAPPPGSTPPRG